MSQSYDDVLREHRRLLILQLLSDVDGYQINEIILQDMVRFRMSATSVDVLRSDCQWLTDQGLAKLDDVGGVFTIKITRRGLDVASGAARVPGIKRPGPE